MEHHELRNEKLEAEAQEPQSVSVPAAGSVVGGAFLIEELIHTGLYASVYRARQLSTERTVAIKVLHSTENKEAVARLHREAVNLSQGKFPGIVQALSCGALDSGQPYLVTEYLEGGSLAEALKRLGKLDGASFLSVFSQILSALSHAHSQGIVHRDLKPANVMLSKREIQDSELKIVDFGLSVDEKQSLQGLTQTGKIMGTPQYMSPEQCLGRNADFRSDLYSVGVMMYEALSGKPPFQAESALALMSMHINEEAPPLSDFPSAITQLIGSALEKEPSKRPDSATAMMKSLESIQLTEWQKMKAGGRSASRPSIKALVLLGICIGIFSCGIFFLRSRYGAAAMAEIYCSGSAGEERIFKLEKLRSSIGPIVGREGSLELVSQELKEAKETYSRRERVRPKLSKSEPPEDKSKGENAKYFEVLSRYVELVPADKHHSIELAQGLLDLAQRKRNPQQSAADYKKAIFLLEQFPQADLSTKLEAYKGYANTLMKSAKYDEALAVYRKIEPPDIANGRSAIALEQSQYESKWGASKQEQRYLKRDVLLHESICYEEKERYEEAIAAQAAALRIDELDGLSEGVFARRNSLAKLLCKSGKVEEAQELLQKNFGDMLKYNNKILALNEYYCTMAECALARGESERARTFILEAIDGYRSAQNALMGRPEALLANDGRLAEAYFDYLDMLEPGTQEFNQQLAECKEHCKMVLSSEPVEPVLKSRMKTLEARSAICRRDYALAQNLTNEAILALMSNSGGKKIVRMSARRRCLELKGDIEIKLGDTSAAIKSYESAYGLSKRRTGAILLAKLAMCREAEGDLEAAEKDYEKLFEVSKSSADRLSSKVREALKAYAGLEEKLGRQQKSEEIRTLL